MQIQKNYQEIKISDLIPYDKNARTHAPKQVEQIEKSIKEFGFTNPLLIDDKNNIIAGHGRLLAAKKLGLDKLPCIVLTGLNSKQKKALILADNKIALNAGWDKELLSSELVSLEVDGFDLSLTGFSNSELDFLLPKKTGETEDDSIPEAVENIKSKLGDIWILGDHRLMCGDSTSIDSINKLMNGEKADLVFTDPPYGVSIGDKNKMLKKFRKGGIEKNIENDTLSPDELKIVLSKAFENVNSVLNDCGAVYVASPQGGGLGMMMMMMMKDAGLEIRHVLIWVKNQPTFSAGRLDYDYQHEPILFTWKKNHKKRMAGEHKSSCWFIDKPQEAKLHPTMKPVEIPLNAILNSSDKGDIVLDVFGGAGSTLIAAEKTGRKARLMELDPNYADVIVRRWQEFTGKKAVHAITCEAFND